MRSAARCLHELQLLERLYAGTLEAYDAVWQRLGAVQSPTPRDRESNSEDAVTRMLPARDAPTLLAPDRAQFASQLRRAYPHLLREVVFTRMISAVEVFLIDTLREAHAARRDLFKRDEQVSFSVAQLLSFRSVSEIATHLVNKELRSLQSGGLHSVQRFYRSRLGVDFNKFPGGFEQVVEYHERRHLLVHRLGRVDKRYREAYGTGEKRLNVGRRYIAQALARMREFVDYVDAETQDRLSADAPEPLRDSGPSTLRVALKLLTPDARQRVLSRHTLIAGDEFVDLADLVTSATSDDAGDLVLELDGRRAHLNAALKLIKQLKRAGYCEIRSVRLTRPARARARGVPHALLLRIADEIRERPIPANRRDEIAQRYDIKLAQASRTIRSINAMPSDGTMQELRSLAPDGQWPADLHRTIAAALAIDPRVAYQGLRQIAWERRRRTDAFADGHAAGNAGGA